MKKIAVLGLVLALVLAFFAFDLNQVLTLDGLKAGLVQIRNLRTESPVMVALVYFCSYVLVTALSLPGAVIMTLAGGALFGLAGGTLIVSFASSIGATLAFLASRGRHGGCVARGPGPDDCGTRAPTGSGHLDNSFGPGRVQAPRFGRVAHHRGGRRGAGPHR